MHPTQPPQAAQPARPAAKVAGPDRSYGGGAPEPEQINALWGEAFNAGDIEAMLALYEPEAVLVPGPGQDPVSGLEAIEASLRWLVSLRGTITHQPRFWLRQGDLAMGRIDFHLTGTDPAGAPVELRGATAEVARRQPDGTWKYVFDHPFSGADVSA